MSLLGVVVLAALCVATLCLVAVATAVAMRSARRALLRFLAIAGPPLLAIGLVTLAASLGPRLLRLDASLRDASLLLLAVSLVGTLAIVAVGVRRSDATGAPRAAAWPRVRLILTAATSALVAVAALALIDGARLREIDRRLADNAARRASLVDEVPEDTLADATYAQAFALLERLPVAELTDLEINHRDPALEGLDAIGPPTREEAEAARDLLVQFAPLLELVDAATAHPSARFDFDPRTADYTTLMPHLGKLRALARINAAAAREAAARGDREETIRRLVAIDRLAEHLAQSPNFLNLLVALAVHSFGTRTAAQLAAIVDLDDPRLLDAAFDAALEERLLRTLAFERSSVESVILAIARGEGDAILEQEFNMPTLPAPTRWLVRALALPVELDSIDRSFDAADDAARRGTSVAERDEPPPGLFAGLLLPTTGKVVDSVRLARAMSALRRAAFVAARGDVAASALPIDPLDPAGGRLRLAREPRVLVLYSVGVNGIDEGGPDQGGDDIGLRILIEAGDGGE